MYFVYIWMNEMEKWQQMIWRIDKRQWKCRIKVERRSYETNKKLMKSRIAKRQFLISRVLWYELQIKNAIAICVYKHQSALKASKQKKWNQSKQPTTKQQQRSITCTQISVNNKNNSIKIWKKKKHWKKMMETSKLLLSFFNAYMAYEYRISLRLVFIGPISVAIDDSNNCMYFMLYTKKKCICRAIYS